MVSTKWQLGYLDFALALRETFEKSHLEKFRINLAQTCGEIAKVWLRITPFEIDSVDFMG